MNLHPSSEFPARFARSALSANPCFLAELGFFLGQAARGAYVEAGVTPSDAIRKARSFNEMGLIILDQLCHLLRRSKGDRSPADFLAALSHWAELGDCSQELIWALSEAEKLVEPFDQTKPPLGSSET